MLAEKLECYTKDDYYSLPEGSAVELIDGVIYNMSPAPMRIHQSLVGEIHFKIKSFINLNKVK